MSAPIGKHFTIWRCAIADLRHEWALNLCVVLSIAALLFPLAVLYGLKFGAISVLENRLQQDPRSRELRPAVSGFFSREWIAEQRNDARVGFAVGLPRSISATVQVVRGDQLIDASILPTGSGDPLLESGALPNPSAKQCVISAELAREAALEIGDDLEFSIARKSTLGWDEVSAQLTVVGILPSFAVDYPAILASSEVTTSVEDYLDGLAVAAMGWEGVEPLALPAFDGCLVFFQSGTSADSKKLENSIRERLGGTGFTSLSRWESPLREGGFFLTNSNSLVDDSNLIRLREKLADLNVVVVPWLDGRTAKVTVGGKSVVVPVYPWSDSLAEIGIVSPGVSSQESLPWDSVLTGSDASASATGTLQWLGVAGVLDIPLRIQRKESTNPEALWIPAENAGKLRRSLERGVVIEGESLVYTRRGYASFRLAARTLNDVLPLQQRLESEGIRVLAETQRIADIQFLEHQLSRIFFLFAMVAGAGAVTCLLALAFSAAERKKRVLAFLQILGATRAEVARFPLIQCLILSLAGSGVAWVSHLVFSQAVNQVFSARLLPGERLSHLPIDVVGVAVGVLLLISFGCYFLLIPRFVGMPLGEAAREP